MRFNEGYIMIESLYWGTLMFSGITAFSRKIQTNKRLNQLCIIITVICIVLIVSSNRTGNDIINYVINYNSVQTFQREPLYVLLKIAGKTLGLNFYQFRAVVSAIGYLLILSTISKYTRNVEFVLFFYCIHLLFMDSMQVRNFLAGSIFVFSIRFLSDLKQKKNLIFYILCVTLEVGIHSAFVFYFILILLLIKGRKTFVYTLFAIGAGLVIVTRVNGNKIPFIDVILSFLMEDNARANNYFSLTTNLGFVAPMFLYLVGIVGLFLVRKQVKALATWNDWEAFFNLIVMINLCFIVVVPMTMMSLTFYRLLRNLLYVNFIVYSKGYFEQPKLKKRWILIAFCLMLCIGWAVFDFSIYATTSDMIDPVFTGELFWK